MNISWVQNIFRTLHAEGVRDLVFCAGARNSPLIATLARTKGFDRHSFFEEREAAFFALGVARRTGQPVVVMCTSGTAAAELLPAVIEAFHTGVPLILITADRPRRLRGTGAPQAIDQTGLFAKFVGLELDLESGEMFKLESWNRRSPLHINICLDEPLIDEPIDDLELTPRPARASFTGQSPFSVSAGVEWAALRLTRFLRSEGTLAVVVGTLETREEREAVAKFLKELRAPVYLECTSGLRERSDLRDFALRSGDKSLAWGLRRGFISRVLRIGGIPTVRIWRDLDEPSSAIEVFSLSPLPFAGLSRGELMCAPIASVLQALSSRPAEPGAMAGAILIKDRSVEPKLLALYEQEPLAEPSLVRALSQTIGDEALVYVGNSLPIREWDLAADFAKPIPVEANRGVNGIDGQLATFIGLARSGRENWAVIGDLTALYSLAGPWALGQRELLTARIVIINNGGGKIFSRLFKTDLFTNRHALEFSHWAKMWGLGYQRWTQVPQEIEPFSKDSVEVIEIVPDEEATARFWNEYDGFWD